MGFSLIKAVEAVNVLGILAEQALGVGLSLLIDFAGIEYPLVVPDGKAFKFCTSLLCKCYDFAHRTRDTIACVRVQHEAR